MMRRAGLEFRDVLAALTTLPARRFSADSGTLEPGALGDVVIFHRDPAEDVTAFAEVAYTVRGGRVVHGGPVR
jgi:imidazolonepropionase-like amidohydrolase